MVNGTSMLSSPSSSLLLSTALPPLNAGAGTAGSFATQAVGSFAELLKGLPGEAGAATPEGEAALALQTPAQAASLAETATASGKILPVALPKAAEGSAEGDSLAVAASEQVAQSEAETPTGAAVVDPLLALLDIAVAPALPGAKGAKGAKSDSAAATDQTGKLPGLPIKTDAKSKVAEGKATDTRNAPAVQISVAAKPEAAPDAKAAQTEPASPAPHKSARAFELARTDAPAPMQNSATSLSAAQPDTPSSAIATPLASGPAQAASAADINAALDRLVAAREALMPAEAALEVDHAEFGEVSIRFEQSSDGRLSAELRAADPELQRAVTAAMGADRNFSMSSEGDSGRSMNLASQRGSASSGDSADGERGQTGNERDMNQKRGTGRRSAHEGQSDQRPGVFA